WRPFSARAMSSFAVFLSNRAAGHGDAWIGHWQPGGHAGRTGWTKVSADVFARMLARLWFIRALPEQTRLLLAGPDTAVDPVNRPGQSLGKITAKVLRRWTWAGRGPLTWLSLEASQESVDDGHGATIYL